VRELLDAFLNREPRITLGIDPAAGCRLSHFFGGISPERCGTRETEKSDDDYDTGNTQSAPKAEMRTTRMSWLHTSEAERRLIFSRAAFAGIYIRHVHFAKVIFLVSRRLAAILRQLFGDPQQGIRRFTVPTR